MTDTEIIEFTDLVEKTWLENLVAREYLKKHCNVFDPANLLSEEIKKLPSDAFAYRVFAPVRQAIGQMFSDSQLFEELHKSLLELARKQ